MNSPRRTLGGAVLGWLALSSCALFSKAEVPARRYFTPVIHQPTEAPRSLRCPVELRLGRVTASDPIAEHIMYRQGEAEVGFYEDRVWTERPEASLRRLLARALFEERGLRRLERGGGATLEVELITFEEVREPTHVGRVSVAFTLTDERYDSLQHTQTFEQPIAKVEPAREGAALALAMGEALRTAVESVANQVTQRFDQEQGKLCLTDPASR